MTNKRRRRRNAQKARQQLAAAQRKPRNEPRQVPQASHHNANPALGQKLANLLGSRKSKIIGVTGAILLAVFTVALEKNWDSISRFVSEEKYERTTSPHEQIVDSMFTNVETANIWAGKPEIYEDSRQYFYDNFKQLDPFVPHQILGNLKSVPIPKLVAEADTFSGRLIEIGGVLKTPPQRFNNTVPYAFSYWVVQIQTGRREDQRITAYALLTSTSECKLKIKDPIKVEGLLVARGTVPALEGGFIEATYIFARDFLSVDKRCRPPAVLPD